MYGRADAGASGSMAGALDSMTNNIHSGVYFARFGKLDFFLTTETFLFGS